MEENERINPLSKCTIDGSTRILRWGIEQCKVLKPHPKRIRSFCEIDSDTYATSDDSHVVIWNKNDVLTEISISALAISYLKVIDQLIAYVAKDTHLYFIRNKPPYKVVCLKKQFSTKAINQFLYFPETSMLVCSGQGITFTKLIIPPYVKSAIPVADALDFEIVSYQYKDFVFTSAHQPTPIYSEQLVIVWIENNIYIHASTGEVIKKFSAFTSTNITALSYFNNKQTMICGEECGKLSTLNLKGMLVGSSTDVKPLVFDYSIAMPIYVDLLDINFALSVTLDKMITVYSLKSGKPLASFKLERTPNLVKRVGDMLFVFNDLEIRTFVINIFTEHFDVATGNAAQLQRHQASKQQAFISYFGNDQAFALYDPIDLCRSFSVRSRQTNDQIRFTFFIRNVYLDGYCSVKSGTHDMFVFIFWSGRILVFGKETKVGKNAQPISDYVSPTMDFDIENYTGIVYNLPTNIDISTIFIVHSKKFPNSLMVVCQTGHIYIISISTGQITFQTYLGFSDIITATACYEMQYVLISRSRSLALFDLESCRITIEKPSLSITALKMWNNDTVICGTSKGTIETRIVPQLTVLHTSEEYHAGHKEKEQSSDVVINKTIELNKVPWAINTIDICAARGLVLSKSINGNVILWDLSMFPQAEIITPFPLHASCFLNGTGSVLISSFETIFKIDWSHVYMTKPQIKESNLDEFDQIKRPKKETHKLRRILTKDVFQYQEPKKVPMDRVLSKQITDDNFFKVQKKKEEPKLEIENSIFTDLIVDIDELPKRFVVPTRPKNPAKPKEKKIVIPPKPKEEPKAEHPSSAISVVSSARSEVKPKRRRKHKKEKKSKPKTKEAHFAPKKPKKDSIPKKKPSQKGDPSNWYPAHVDLEVGKQLVPKPDSLKSKDFDTLFKVKEPVSSGSSTPRHSNNTNVLRQSQNSVFSVSEPTESKSTRSSVRSLHNNIKNNKSNSTMKNEPTEEPTQIPVPKSIFKLKEEKLKRVRVVKTKREDDIFSITSTDALSTETTTDEEIPTTDEETESYSYVTESTASLGSVIKPTDSLISLSKAPLYLAPESSPPIPEVTMEEFLKHCESHRTIFVDDLNLQPKTPKKKKNGVRDSLRVIRQTMLREAEENRQKKELKPIYDTPVLNISQQEIADRIRKRRAVLVRRLARSGQSIEPKKRGPSPQIFIKNAGNKEPPAEPELLYEERAKRIRRYVEVRNPSAHPTIPNMTVYSNSLTDLCAELFGTRK